MAEIPEADVTNSTSNDYPHTDLKEESDKCNTRSDAPRAGSFNALLFLQVLLGILCAFKPAEPFVVPYYIDNGISMDQINQTVFPMSGYSNFGFLVLQHGVDRDIPSRTALFWLGWLCCVLYAAHIRRQANCCYFAEVFYGLAVASETVYCATFYFLKNRTVSVMTSHLRASTISRTTLLVTHVISDLFGQLMVSFITNFSKRLLFIITAISVSSSVVLANTYMYSATH